MQAIGEIQGQRCHSHGIKNGTRERLLVIRWTTMHPRRITQFPIFGGKVYSVACTIVLTKKRSLVNPILTHFDRHVELIT